MPNETPASTFDVVIHDGTQGSGWKYIYRVAFFGELSGDWLREWKTMFYDIPDAEGHAAYLAEVLHQGRSATFAEGYGDIMWLEKSWRRVAIWTARGEEVAFAAVKRIDGSQPTKKYDYVTVAKVEWEGFDARINS